MANLCSYSFVDGAFLEVAGTQVEQYDVEFVDTANGSIVHAGRISNNEWIRTARQFFTPWRINVYTGSPRALVFTHVFYCRGKRVYISFESKALGDTLAWFAAVDAFRRKHGCELICSTFHNDLFRHQYKNIRFVSPGTEVKHLYARYRLGWFYNDSGTVDRQRNPTDFKSRPLGATATDILGLDYEEARPRLPPTPGSSPLPEKYVCIGIHATAQAKYWNHPDGWAELTAYLQQRGYRVILLSREGREYMGNVAPEAVTVLPAGSILNVVHYLRHSQLFVGVGSGLSWLAWSAGVKTCIISGFSLPFTEPADCVRVAPAGTVCSGCFNKERLDAGDWHWCPFHKGTSRMFECTASITTGDVIAAINGFL